MTWIKELTELYSRGTSLRTEKGLRIGDQSGRLLDVLPYMSYMVCAAALSKMHEDYDILYRAGQCMTVTPISSNSHGLMSISFFPLPSASANCS